MSDLDVDAIEARAAAAHAGPWWADLHSYGDIWANAGQEGATIVVSADPAIDDADAEFIAHARTDVPALVSRIRELERENEWLQRNADQFAPSLANLTEAVSASASRIRELEAIVRKVSEYSVADKTVIGVAGDLQAIVGSEFPSEWRWGGSETP